MFPRFFLINFMKKKKTKHSLITFPILIGSYKLFWEKGKTHIAEQKKKVFFFFQYIHDISIFRF